jgi:hypothetical protein
VTVQKPTQVTSCFNLLGPLCQLFSKVEMQGCVFDKFNECSLSNIKWHLFFTLLARIDFGDTVPCSPMLQKSTILSLVNRSCDTGTLNRFCQIEHVSRMGRVTFRSVLYSMSHRARRRIIVCFEHDGVLTDIVDK